MVSILQLFILIIPGVAFRVLILLVCCQKAGSWGWWPGKQGQGWSSEEAEVLQHWVFLQSFSRSPSRKAGRPPRHLPGSVQKLQALRPQVYLVSEHLVVKRILVGKRSLIGFALIPGGKGSVSPVERVLCFLYCSHPPFSQRSDVHV